MTAEEREREREIEHEEKKEEGQGTKRGEGGQPCFPRVDVITV